MTRQDSVGNGVVYPWPSKPDYQVKVPYSRGGGCMLPLYVGVEGNASDLPQAPGNLGASPQGFNNINISWIDNADNEFRIELQQAKDSSFTEEVELLKLQPNAENGTAADLEYQTTYYFRARAYNNKGYSDWSNMANATTAKDPHGDGDGLVGYYFNNRYVEEPAVLTRIDSVISFDWGNGSPHPDVVNDGFSAKWTGELLPIYSETHKFCTKQTTA